MLKFLRRIIIEFREYIILIILSVISLSLIAANEKPQVKKIRTFAVGSFAIFSHALNSAVSFLGSDSSKDELELENAHLMLELNRLRNQARENVYLRSMLAFKDTTKYPLVSADVISKLVNKTQGNYIVSVGSRDGINSGMPVITDKGLAGIVSDVAENYSTIKTLYNSNLNIAITIQRINVDGILSWDGRELIIKNVPTTYDVNVGDLVITSDFSTVFPPSVPIGVVSKREEIKLGLLHTISVKPFVDISSVHDVFIVKAVPDLQINQLEMNLMK